MSRKRKTHQDVASAADLPETLSDPTDSFSPSLAVHGFTGFGEYQEPVAPLVSFKLPLPPPASWDVVDPTSDAEFEESLRRLEDEEPEPEKEPEPEPEKEPEPEPEKEPEPEPEPQEPEAAPEPQGQAPEPVKYGPFLSTDVINVLTPNPKRGRSRERYACYVDGGTVADFIRNVTERCGTEEAKKCVPDLHWDIGHTSGSKKNLICVQRRNPETQRLDVVLETGLVAG